MQSVEVNEVSLSYVQNGKGADTVFVHGIPTDYRAWNAQIEPFSEVYRVTTYSRRHAQPNDNKGSLQESTIENNASDLEGLIRETTSPPVNLIGHSYGGFIAAYLSATRSGLVKKVVLIEPGISTLLVQDPESRAQALSLLFRSPSIALAARSYIQNYFNPLLKAYRKGDLNTALGYFLDGLMNKTDALGQLPGQVQAMVKENAKTIGEVEAKLPHFTQKDASRISVPTLLINGANVTKIFRAINEKLAKSVPDNELALIPDSSHFPHFENPDGFNTKVLGFLARS